jgi:hypothetical protein
MLLHVFMIRVERNGKFCGMLSPLYLRFKSREHAETVAQRYRANEENNHEYIVVESKEIHWVTTAPELIDMR